MSEKDNVVDFAAKLKAKALTPEAVKARHRADLTEVLDKVDADLEALPHSVVSTLLVRLGKAIGQQLVMYEDTDYMEKGGLKNAKELPEMFRRGAAAGAMAASATLTMAIDGVLTSMHEFFVADADAPDGPRKEGTRAILAAFSAGMVEGEKEFENHKAGKAGK